MYITLSVCSNANHQSLAIIPAERFVYFQQAAAFWFVFTVVVLVVLSVLVFLRFHAIPSSGQREIDEKALSRTQALQA
jgi:hypothetical protein